MIDNEKPDYDDWTDEELAEALHSVEKSIEHYQQTIVLYRKNLNRGMEDREDLLDIIAQRAQVRKKKW